MALQFMTVDKPFGEQSDLEIFIGEVRYQHLVHEEDTEHLKSAHVTFREGARTKWHRHGCDQILIITAGHGIVADEEKETPVRKDDVILIPKNTKHWHGSAGEGSYLSHISVLTRGEEWLDED